MHVMFGLRFGSLHVIVANASLSKAQKTTVGRSQPGRKQRHILARGCRRRENELQQQFLPWPHHWPLLRHCSGLRFLRLRYVKTIERSQVHTLHTRHPTPPHPNHPLLDCLRTQAWSCGTRTSDGASAVAVSTQRDDCDPESRSRTPRMKHGAQRHPSRVLSAAFRAQQATATSAAPRSAWSCWLPGSSCHHRWSGMAVAGMGVQPAAQSPKVVN